MKAILVLVTLFAFAARIAAQQSSPSATHTASVSAPEAPSAVARTRMPASEAVKKKICTKEGAWYRCPQTVEITFPNRVVTPSFATWMVASSAAMVADFETTARGVQRGCRELNPIYGSSPDRTRLYAIGVPLHAVVAWLTYRSKRAHYRYWWFAEASLTATHALAAGINAANC